MPPASYRTIAHAGENEQIIKKSRFICAVARVTSKAAAEAFVQRVQAAHPKANHHVPAYLLGSTDAVQRATDDGEPSGTAGVPMLRVLQELQLHDVVAVTTRYFGGIKLGASGLIRAYAGSVSAAVASVGIVARVPQTALVLTLAYPQLGALEHWLATNNLQIVASQYTERVSLTINVADRELAATQAAITDLLNGQVDLATGAHSFAEVPVTD